MEGNGLGAALVRSVVDTSENRSLARDLAEVGLDTVVDNDVVRRLPVVGMLYTIGKGVVTIPDRVFYLKLVRFLKGVGSIPPKDIEKWLERLESEGGREHFGEHMFTAIDALNSQWKAELVGRITRGSILRGESTEDLVRVVDMVQVAYAGDLRYLLDRTTTGEPFGQTGDEVEALLAAGFRGWRGSGCARGHQLDRRYLSGDGALTSAGAVHARRPRGGRA